MVFTTSAVGLRSHVDLGRVALAFTAPVTVIHIEPTEPDVALSGVVDTCSISTGDGWTEGTGKGIRGSNR